MEISVKDFDKCCRCCLIMVNDMKPLFGACLNVMLAKLMNLQVTPIDGYPQQMCSRCILKLSSAYTFHITVLKNQKTLEDILKAAVKSREIPVIAASYEKIELDGPGKVINTLEQESLVYQAACIQPLNPPQATITPNKKRTSNTVNHSRKPEIEGEDSSADEESYQCSQCKHSSKDEEDLKSHLQTHLGTESVSKGETDVKAQLCNICGARFRLRTSLHKHLRQHAPGGRRRCPRPRCRSSFAEAATLNLHLLSHSADPKPYRCSVCGRSFTQPASRARHARRHLARPRLPCPRCRRSFLHTSSLRRHCAGAHSPPAPARSPVKKVLDVHMRCHKKEEMDCSDMERPTDNIPTEPINIQTVTVEFLCLLCTTTFQTRESLEVHICSKENIT